MEDLRVVINKCVELMEYPLNFGSVTITPMGVLIGMFVLSLAIYFVSEVFTN